MSNQLQNILILGTGKVAKSFANEFAKNDPVNVKVWGRSNDGLNEFSTHQNIQTEDDFEKAISWAHFIMVAVSDDSIQEMAIRLQKTSLPVVHLSGATSIDVLVSENIENCGVCWPIMSFNKENQDIPKGIPLAIELSNDFTEKVIMELFSLLAFNFYKLSFEKRKALHISAVMSNNFVHHLLNVVSQILSENDIPPQLLEPILEESFGEIQWDKLHETQTGPAVRGDQKTIKEHLNWLQNNNTWNELYKSLSDSIQKVHSEKS